MNTLYEQKKKLMKKIKELKKKKNEDKVKTFKEKDFQEKNKIGVQKSHYFIIKSLLFASEGK